MAYRTPLTHLDQASSLATDRPLAVSTTVLRKPVIGMSYGQVAVSTAGGHRGQCRFWCRRLNQSSAVRLCSSAVTVALRPRRAASSESPRRGRLRRRFCSPQSRRSRPRRCRRRPRPPHMSSTSRCKAELLPDRDGIDFGPRGPKSTSVLVLERADGRAYGVVGHSWLTSRRGKDDTVDPAGRFLLCHGGHSGGRRVG